MLVPTIDAASRWRRRCAAVCSALTLVVLASAPVPGAAAEPPAHARLAAAKFGATGSDPAVAPARTADKVLAGRYIVELAEGVAAADVARDYRGTVSVRRRYTKALAGFAASMSATSAAALRGDPRIRSVEPDVELTLSGVQSSPPWGLDRTDQRRRPLDDTYVYDSSGAGVAIYVVDTGVFRNHREFGNRVLSGYDATGGGTTDDCVGHGTHVAGTAAGATFGIAKRAHIVPIRVLNCRGVGTKSELIAGLDWLVRDHRRGVPAVANLSLGGPASSAVDRAVNRVLDDGVTVIAAAGNEGDTYWGNACGYSPARVGPVLTVGATDRYDQAPLWSNFGPCLDLFAPGVGIKSAAPWNRTATATQSGTSMAAPLVTGVAARFLARHPSAGPRHVADVIKSQAIGGIVAYAGQNTTQRLLHVPTRMPTRIAAWLSDDSVALGGFTVVRAALRNSASGRTISGAALKVYSRRPGTTAWHFVARRTTDWDGRVALRLQPARTMQYLVRHNATSETRSAVSDITKAVVGARAITALSISTSPPVTYPGVADISGTLRRSFDGSALADKPVELLRRAAGGTAWSVVETRRTGSDGRVVFSDAPTRNREYRLRYAGNASLLPAASGAQRVDVRFAVTAAPSASSGTIGTDTIDLTGEVKPIAKEAGDRFVYIEYREPDDYDWYRTKVWYDAAGAFSHRVIDEWAWIEGTYEFRVRALADGSNAQGISSVHTVQMQY